MNSLNCTKCNSEICLPISPGPRANALAGIERRGALCKRCAGTSRVSKYNKTEKGKKKARAFDIKHRVSRVAATRRWRHNNPERVKELGRKYLYGLTTETHNELCDRDKICAICKRAVKLRIDHDHTTEKVRGRLCDRCNTGLGKLGDNIAGVTRALIYLQERS